MNQSTNTNIHVYLDGLQLGRCRHSQNPHRLRHPPCHRPFSQSSPSSKLKHWSRSLPFSANMAISIFASFRTYVLSSILLTTAVLSHTIFTKRYFYVSVVHLSNSKFASLAVSNMTLATVLCIWRLIQVIFLGPLRFRETERLHIRARDAIIECCFAISVFRDELDKVFIALVMSLLLVKSLHWLTKDRIEFLEEQPLAPRSTHVRLGALMILLATLDSFLVTKCVSATINASGRTMFVLFAFEFTLLQIELLADAFKYVFLVIDMRMDNRWDSKSLYTFYSELVCDMCHLTVYIIFFIYVQIHYGFPFHIIRELYMTFHKFRSRCIAFLRYRRVVATMNDLFADATEEELAEGDRTCIICREEMTAAKKLACSHMFHARCLQSWLKRQLSCPTCRATIDVFGNPQNNQQNNQQNNPQNQEPNQQPNQQPNQPPNQHPNQQQDNQNYMQNPNQQHPRRQQRRAQQPVNLADAGQRLLNDMNDWWNQLMNNAGAQRQNPQRQPVLHGPNALAHHQLRLRRRGAWPGPYQPYAPPAMNQNVLPPLMQPMQQPPQHQPQQPQPHPQPQQLRESQGPQPQQEPNSATATRNQTTVRSATGSTLRSGASSSAASSSTAAPPSQASRARPTLSRTQEQSSAISAASSRSSTSGQASRSTERANPRQDTDRTPNVSSLPPLPPPNAIDPERLITVFQYVGAGSQTGRGPGQNAYPSPTSDTMQAIPSNQEPPILNTSEDTSNTQMFPLGRLLAIQEQIEVLRSEVEALVLLATSPPPSESAAEQPSGANPDVVHGNGAQASSTEDRRHESNVADENRAISEHGQSVETNEVPQEANAEEDSEAARLRRRRSTFLAQRSQAS